MKTIVFTLLAISHHDQIYYLQYCKRLALDILEQTKHDVIITTNNVPFFDDISDNQRVIVRELPDEDVTLFFNNAFNYNLKYMCFYDIPDKYDLVFYLDCDMKIEGPSGERWDDDVDEYISNLFDYFGWDSIGTRTNASLKYEMLRYVEEHTGLFWHKITVYGEDFILSMKEDILDDTPTPSEHFFILKNDPEKINTLYQTWRMLNQRFENNPHGHSAVHDALEIGLSLKIAGYRIQELPISEYQSLKLKFNGNKI